MRDLDWADDRTLIISVSRSLTAGATTVAEQRYEFERYLALDVEDPGGTAKSLLMEHPDRELVSGASLERLHPEKPGTVIMSTYNFSGTAYREEIGSRISGGRKDSGWELALFEVDIKSGKGRMIESGSPYTDEWILDAAGRPVARSEWNPESRRYSILAKRGDSWQSIYSAEIDYEFDLAGLSADGASLLARSPRGSDRFKVWALPLSGGEPSLLYEHPRYDVTSVQFDRFTGVPAGYWVGGPNTKIVWTDPKLESIQKAISKAFAGKITSFFDRSADYKRIVAEVESPTSPPMYYLVDFGKGSADIIGEAYPTLADATLGTLESTSYKAQDGYEIPAYLTLPPGLEPKSLPLVVFPHGGPYARDMGDFDWWAQFLATRGYVVLQPQFRVRRDSAPSCSAPATSSGAGACRTTSRPACTTSWTGDRGPEARVHRRRQLWRLRRARRRRLHARPLCLRHQRQWHHRHPADGRIHPRASRRRFRRFPLVARPNRRSQRAGHHRILAEPLCRDHPRADPADPCDQRHGRAADPSRATLRQLLRQGGKAHELIELPGEDHWLSRARRA